MKRIYVILIISFTVASAQSRTEIFPGRLNIKPFTANILEPKLGFLFQTNNNELRLDIGNSADFVWIPFNDGSILSFGADLFTFTLLESEGDFHFPVIAVDYLFGINAGYKTYINDLEIGGRFRLSHISAHFVDGHFDGVHYKWENDQNPRVYSKEFIELIPYLSYDDLRIYFGLTYNIHIDPAHLGKDNYQCGIEYFMNDLLSPEITPFAGYDLRVIHIDKYTANHSISAGVKLGKADRNGVSIYFNYYKGNNIHGEFFDFKSEYSALGINLDL